MAAELRDVYQFGRALLDAGDLDPVYTVVYGARLSLPELERWLLAYWCFYDVGTASWCADVKTEREYWPRMWEATCSPSYPRGRERRHFRAKNAERSMDYLGDEQLSKLFDFFRAFALSNTPVPAHMVMEEAQRWVGFGPWISFKVADMLDRCGYCKVAFSVETAFFYDSPRNAANTLWHAEGQPGTGYTDDDIGRCHWAVDRITGELNSYSAPPSFDRPLNCQEAETILCKWGSSLTGHYHVGEDVQAVKAGLLRNGFGRCKLSQRLRRAGKEAGLWS